MISDSQYIKDVLSHREEVKSLVLEFVKKLTVQANNHDTSKLKDPEKTIFMENDKNYRKIKYGTEEYKEHLEKIKPALKHHYENNRHHPEHFENGIRDMNLVDIVEMFFDWYAVSNDIEKSLFYNEKRFKYSEDLTQIFINTVDLMKNSGKC